MAARAYPIERNTRRRSVEHARVGRTTVDGYPLRLIRDEELGESSVLKAAGIRPARPVRLARVTPLLPPVGARASGARSHVTPGSPATELTQTTPEEFVRIANRQYRVAELRRARRRKQARRRLAAVATAVATCGVMAGLSFGSGALRSLGQAHLTVPPGSVATVGGYLYRVRPGDTLWSIATRVVGDGDPRPLVAQLEAELHGATLEPGARLLVP